MAEIIYALVLFLIFFSMTPEEREIQMKKNTLILMIVLVCSMTTFMCCEKEFNGKHPDPIHQVDESDAACVDTASSTIDAGTWDCSTEE